MGVLHNWSCRGPLNVSEESPAENDLGARSRGSDRAPACSSCDPGARNVSNGAVWAAGSGVRSPRETSGGGSRGGVVSDKDGGARRSPSPPLPATWRRAPRPSSIERTLEPRTRRIVSAEDLPFPPLLWMHSLSRLLSRALGNSRTSFPGLIESFVEKLSDSTALLSLSTAAAPEGTGTMSGESGGGLRPGGRTARFIVP